MVFHTNIVKLAKENSNFRKVVATGTLSQIVLMSIAVGEDIGEETHHDVDQTLVFVQGHGTAIIEGKKFSVGPNDLVMVPAGTRHNFLSNGPEDLKLFTLYAPPEHKQGVVRKTKKDAVTFPE